MNDVTLKELIKEVQTFCEDRDWDQFHNPKDLAIGISTEANELLDLFRFKSEADMKELFEDTKKRVRIEEEIADVLFFVLRFAQRNEIDLENALKDKIAKNGKKYSIQNAKGSNKKYDEFDK